MRLPFTTRRRLPMRLPRSDQYVTTPALCAPRIIVTVIIERKMGSTL